MPTVFSRPPAEVNYSSPIVTLARELQHEILQYLTLSPSRNRPALYILASTCQALLSISLPFILYRVHLRPVSGIQASNRQSTLLRALERDVRLRSYIKVVTLNLSHMPSQLGTEQTDYYNTRRILEWLGAVRKLDLQCHSIAGWRELLVDAEGGFSLEPLRAHRAVLSSPALTSLSISGISVPSTIFGLCPHLNALVLESGGALRRCEVDDSESLNAPQLKTLSIAHISGILYWLRATPTEARRFAFPDLRQLKHLSILDHRAPPPFNVASKPKALESLEFVWALDKHDDSDKMFGVMSGTLMQDKNICITTHLRRFAIQSRITSQNPMERLLGVTVEILLNLELGKAFEYVESVKFTGNVCRARAFSSYCLDADLQAELMDFTLASVRERAPNLKRIEIMVQCTAKSEQADDPQVVKTLANCWRVHVSRHQLATALLASVGIQVAFSSTCNGFDLAEEGLRG